MPRPRVSWGSQGLFCGRFPGKHIVPNRAEACATWNLRLRERRFGKVVILGRHARQRSGLCIPLEGCRVKVYQSYDTLQCHLHVGNHLLKLERETAYDKIQGKWTAACKSVAGSYVRGGLYLHQQPVRHIKCTTRADSRRKMGSKEV